MHPSPAPPKRINKIHYLMDLEQSLANHLTIFLSSTFAQKPNVITSSHPSALQTSQLVDWFLKRKFSSFLTFSLLSLSYYIFAPSIPFLNRESDKMFKRRPDKTTTGLINPTIDCFANSTAQALASLPGLNVYLNEILSTQSLISKLLKERDPSDIQSENTSYSHLCVPPIPLHYALSILLSQLQKTIYERRSISVWDFLNVLEKIFKSKISKFQHDAHELLQLILETLEKEYVSLQVFIGVNEERLDCSPVTIPEFPFSSVAINQLTSLECGGSSSLGFDHMAIYSLPTPRKPSISLTNLIKDNQREVIEGYNCVKCNVLFCIDKLSKSSDPTPVEQNNLEKFKELNVTLKINDDLDPSLQAVVDQICKRYKYELKSTLIKNHGLAIPPKILPIHLSRSIFLQSQAVRNSCKVQFDEILTLDVNEHMLEEAQEFMDKNLKDSIQKAKEHQPTQSDNIFNGNFAPNLLFTEDEKVAGREEDLFVEDAGQNSGEESLLSQEETDNYELDTEPTDLDSSENAESGKPVRTYTYRLQAVICHQGSHRIGHYDCYRRKPLYYKNSTSHEFSCDLPELLFKEAGEENNEPAPENLPFSESTPSSEESDNDLPTATAKPLERSGSSFRRRMSSIISITKPKDEKHSSGKSSGKESKDSRKPISSSVKYPFWKISDSKVTEYKLEDVLKDSGAAYMLFYELLPLP